jgi:hypothetical protein
MNEAPRSQAAVHLAVATSTEADTPSEIAAAVASARRRKDPEEAVSVVCRALRANQGHHLRPNDLVWLAAELGAWKAGGAVASAIARWLDHHGDTHPRLFDTAVEIASLDNSEDLDASLLLARPDSFRWLEHATWVAQLLVAALSSSSDPRWRFEPLDENEDVAAFKRLATAADASFADHARAVLSKHGAAARTGLRGARGRAAHGTAVRLLLDVWEAAFT